MMRVVGVRTLGRPFELCKELLELAIQKEGAEKTLFGGYSSPRIQALQSIMASYQKDNLFLGEQSLALVQESVYEIPALRKQVESARSQLQVRRGGRECDGG